MLQLPYETLSESDAFHSCLLQVIGRFVLVYLIGFDLVSEVVDGCFFRSGKLLVQFLVIEIAIHVKELLHLGDEFGGFLMRAFDA